MANDQRLFVTVNSPLGSLMASKNQAVGQMNFQTEVTGVSETPQSIMHKD